MSLATKYRPQTFDTITEQNVTTTILKKQIETRTFKNGYGFFGASGCGKTTSARAFAKAINGPMYEPIEIDGGTIAGGEGESGAEKVRKLTELANQRDLSGEYKIIIIDECQNLGGGRKENNASWAALLKTLEECPKYTIFILCSTNPEKIPQAILNRIQRYNFAPISNTGIYNRLTYICEQEGFTNYEKTCELISKAVHGGMRDAITYLEQVSDYSTNLDLDVAKRVFGGLSYESMFKLTWAIQKKDETEIIAMIDEMYNAGQDIKSFISLYLGFVLDLIKYKLFKDITVTNIPNYLATEDNPVVQFTVEKDDAVEYFKSLVDQIFEIKSLIKTDTDYKSTVIILLLQFVR